MHANGEATAQETPLLETQGLSVAYGGLHALEDITIQVHAGEFVTVVGANGAGKTTLLKSISGTVPLSAGRISYHGHDLGSTPGHARAIMGMAHVPEGRKVFPTLSVLENLELGAYRPTARVRRQASLQMVFDLFPILYERRRQAAGTLSGGEQQMLALGRGLMLCPELLLLDEPSLGLAPLLVEAIFDSIVRLRAAQRLTILLVEQRVVEALELCDRGYVLEAGRLVLAGKRRRLTRRCARASRLPGGVAPQRATETGVCGLGTMCQVGWCCPPETRHQAEAFRQMSCTAAALKESGCQVAWRSSLRRSIMARPLACATLRCGVNPCA